MPKNQNDVTEPVRSVRRTVSLRSVLVVIAAVALILGAAKQVLVSRDLKRRGPASQKLLLPLIQFHGQQIEGYQLLEREELKLTRKRSRHFGEEASRALRSVARDGRKFRLPQEVRDFGKYVRSLVVNPPGHQGPTVLQNYQVSEWAARMVTYHNHMKAYYEKLLSELWTELPPNPSSLDEELKALTAEIQRINHIPTADLYLETAPHLRPGAPQPKPPPGGYPDSQSY
jgi:hypothetical protein